MHRRLLRTATATAVAVTGLRLAVARPAAAAATIDVRDDGAAGNGSTNETGATDRAVAAP